MSKVYDHIIPKIEHWPIYHLYQNREQLVQDLNAYTYSKFEGRSVDAIKESVASTIYLEKIRVKKEPWKVDPRNEDQYWKRLEGELNRISEGDDQAYHVLLKKIINRYSEEIAGGFNAKTFRRARKYLTFFFKRLLNTAAGRNYKRLWGSKHELNDRLKVEGHVEEMRALMSIGTVIMVPTHFSNLDSIMTGYMLDSVAGVPAFSYGAGLNLYDAELVAYFINRLGAYKVDRRKKNPIYAETLRSFSAVTAQKNVHSLFFPGGTRSRSGVLEKSLKLGLLGTMIESQRKLLEEGKDRKIFIVPLIKSYHFVLEGKFMIDQYLKILGKEKYTKTKVRDTSIKSMISFLWKVFSDGADITFSFGEPMDVFGNIVDNTGQSYDERNNPIEIDGYFKSQGAINFDAQREKIYTRHLGDKIIKSFHRNNVVLSSHVVNFVAFRFLEHTNRKSELFSILSLPPDEFRIPADKFKMMVKNAILELKEMRDKNKLKLSDEFYLSIDEFIANGIKYSGSYHASKPLILFENKDIGSEDLRLLYYYHNRLLGYNLESKIELNEPANYKYTLQID